MRTLQGSAGLNFSLQLSFWALDIQFVIALPVQNMKFHCLQLVHHTIASNRIASDNVP